MHAVNPVGPSQAVMTFVVYSTWQSMSQPRRTLYALSRRLGCYNFIDCMSIILGERYITFAQSSQIRDPLSPVCLLSSVWNVGLGLICPLAVFVSNAITTSAVSPNAQFLILYSLLSIQPRSAPSSHLCPQITTFMQMTHNSTLPHLPSVRIHSNITHLQNALQQISSWMTADLFSLSTFLKLSFFLSDLNSNFIKIYDSSHSTTHSARNLGFIFDEHLTFSDQITTLIIYHFFTLSLQAQNLPFRQILSILILLLLSTVLTSHGTGPDLSCFSIYY